MKKFRVQSVLVLNYKKRSDHKIFRSRAKLINNDSNTDDAFEYMHQSIMTKIKNSACEDWVFETIAKHSIKIFECYYRRK